MAQKYYTDQHLQSFNEMPSNNRLIQKYIRTIPDSNFNTFYNIMEDVMEKLVRQSCVLWEGGRQPLC
jgi:hypothetical protein